AMKNYDHARSKLIGRDERISVYLQDVVGWRNTTASNNLARKMEVLTRWIIVIAVLTVAVTILTDKLKDAIFDHMGAFVHSAWGYLSDAFSHYLQDHPPKGV